MHVAEEQKRNHHGKVERKHEQEHRQGPEPVPPGQRHVRAGPADASTPAALARNLLVVRIDDDERRHRAGDDAVGFRGLAGGPHGLTVSSPWPRSVSALMRNMTASTSPQARLHPIVPKSSVAHILAPGRGRAERAGEGQRHDEPEQDLRDAGDRVEERSDRRSLADGSPG